MAVCSSCIVLWLSLQAELLTGLPVSSVEDASQVGLDLLKKGCGSVIVTLGPQGCVVCQSLNVVPKLVPSTTVNAVDTTVRLCSYTIKILHQYIYIATKFQLFSSYKTLGSGSVWIFVQWIKCSWRHRDTSQVFNFITRKLMR